jgi:hypothetical protein
MDTKKYQDIEQKIQEKKSMTVSKKPVLVTSGESDAIERLGEVPVQKSETVAVPQMHWLSIAGAVGMISNLATTTAMVDLQAKKELSTPAFKTELFIEKSNLGQERTLNEHFVPKQQKGTIDASGKDKLKIISPEKEIPKSKEMPETLLPERLKASSEVDEAAPLPIHITIPKHGGIEVLDHIAKRSVTPKNILFKPDLPMKSDNDFDIRPTLISKRIGTTSANLPSELNLAIKQLGSGVTKSRSSLFIDKIQPKYSSTVYSSVKTKRTRGKKQATKTKEQIIALKKTSKDDDLLKRGFSLHKPVGQQQQIEQSVIIDKDSFAALNNLKKIAAITAMTTSGIYSKSPTAKLDAIDILTPKPISKVTNGYEIEELKPLKARGIKTDQFRVLDEPKHARKKPSETRFEKYLLKPKDELGSMEISESIESDSTIEAGGDALDILSAIALNASLIKHSIQDISPDSKKVKSKDKATLKGKLVSGQKSIEPKDDLLYRGYTESPNYQKIMSMLTKERQKRKAMKHISEAIGLIKPPEKSMAKYLSVRGEVDRAEQSVESAEGREGYSGLQSTSKLASERKHSKDKLSKIDKDIIKKEAEMYLVKTTKVVDFKGLPPYAPEKDTGDRDYMHNLEEQIRSLKDKLESSKTEDLPSNRRLSEIVHDPNLHTQLKKLFYEAWLENMDKELKRYGE